jgi:RNA recognition motif-containing protein
MNIYISNLSYSASDDNLNELFASFGEISTAKVIFDKYTNKSRGFGFVEMSNDEEAAKAIEELNQTDHMGKTINVSEAKPKEDRPARTFRSNDRGGNDRGGNDRGGYGGGGNNRGGGGGYGSDKRDNNRW